MANITVGGVEYTTATCPTKKQEVVISVPGCTNIIPEQRCTGYCYGLEVNGQNKRVTLIKSENNQLEILSCTAKNGNCPFFRRQ